MIISSFNHKIIMKVTGAIMTLLGIAMVPPLFIAVADGENNLVFAFLLSMVPCLGIGLFLMIRSKPESTMLKIRDGYLIASGTWILVSLIGALPYVFSGVMPNMINAFFESVSGFTATGATVIDDLSAMPKALLFWRAFCHWLGGMGILVLAISLLPALGIGGYKLASAEAPGPTMEKMSGKMADSAKILYLIYVFFTLLEVALLYLGGMNLFDATLHTFSSISTSGLSNYSDGIAHFNSLYLELIIAVFSILGSINFVLYYHLIWRRWREFFADAELRAFLLILAGAIFVIMLNLKLSGTISAWGESLRFAIFQSTSFISTSGCSITDYTLWPSFSQMILLCLMFIGGCSASTSGSLKVVRFLILLKLARRGLYRFLHPNAVVPIKLGSKTIPSDTVVKVNGFTILFFTIFLLTALVVSFDNYDLITTLSASAAMLTNTGAGLSLLGPGDTFNIFSVFTRLFLSFVMIAGRLELFTFLLLFTPAFWKNT